MRIIVSLTSYPPRIDSVHKVVESLYRQIVPADEIVLYLSLDEFPQAATSLPEKLKSLIGQGGFRVAWVHGNLKSHKKYYYALQEYKGAVLITVDDDKIYAKTMIADLINSYKRFPSAVSARRVRIILKSDDSLEPYSKWEKEKYLEEYIDVPRMDLCAIGTGGICYPPVLVNENWFDKELLVKTADAHDDLWLKYNEIISNIPVVYTRSAQEDITIDNSQTCRLAANNLYGNGNDECISKLLKLFKERSFDRYHEWFRGLMTREEYVIAKKKYYSDIFNSVFDKVGNVPIYFCGAGKIARRMLMILADLGVTKRVTAIAVSNISGNTTCLYGLQVRALSELDTDRKFGVLFGMSETNKKEFLGRLSDYNYITIELDLQIIKRYYLR
jgi:hypothetical protein